MLRADFSSKPILNWQLNCPLLVVLQQMLSAQRQRHVKSQNWTLFSVSFHKIIRLTQVTKVSFFVPASLYTKIFVQPFTLRCHKCNHKVSQIRELVRITTNQFCQVNFNPEWVSNLLLQDTTEVLCQCGRGRKHTNQPISCGDQCSWHCSLYHMRKCKAQLVLFQSQLLHPTQHVIFIPSDDSQHKHLANVILILWLSDNLHNVWFPCLHKSIFIELASSS